MKKPIKLKDTNMTEVAAKARGSRKGSVRKPQEFLGIVSVKNANTGEALNLADYTVEIAISKDYKGALSIVKADPTRSVVELTMPKFKVAAEAAE